MENIYLKSRHSKISDPKNKQIWIYTFEYILYLFISVPVCLKCFLVFLCMFNISINCKIEDFKLPVFEKLHSVIQVENWQNIVTQNTYQISNYHTITFKHFDILTKFTFILCESNKFICSISFCITNFITKKPTVSNFLCFMSRLRVDRPCSNI